MSSLGTIGSRGRRRGITVAAALALALVATLFVGTATAPAAVSCTTPPPTMDVGSLTPGMTGTGYTTIRGTTPTQFDVEVLGVMTDYIWLDVDAIVIRITGPASFLDSPGGVFYGMSGSPVYVNGRLIGAVSYGVSWDPTIVGLTPAAAMLRLVSGGSSSASIPQTIPLTRAVRQRIGAETGFTPSAGEGLDLLPSYLGASGLSTKRLKELQDMVDEHGGAFQVRRSSSMPANLPVDQTPFVPGQPVGSVLSWGDYTVWAAGTVSIVCGGDLVAYGHSLFWSPPGAVTIGMTGVNVLGVGNGHGLFFGDMIPNLTSPRGTFTTDSFSGEAGSVGQAIPSAPITSTITSLDNGTERTGTTEAIYQSDWWLENAVWGHHVLNFGAVQNGLGAGTGSLSWTVDGERPDGTPFQVTNRWMAASPYDSTEVVWRLIETIDILKFNEFAPLEVTGIHTTGSVSGDQLVGEISRIRTSSSLQRTLRERSVVRAKPGDTVTVEVTLTRGQAQPTVARLRVKVPRRAGDTQVRIRGGRGRSLYGNHVGSLDELIASLNGGDHPNDLIATAYGRIVQQQPLVVTGRGSFRIDVVR